MEDRETRLLLRSWIMGPVSEGSLEYKKGYRCVLRVADDPKFIELFKSTHDMCQRIYDLEDEAYARVNAPKMEVIR